MSKAAARQRKGRAGRSVQPGTPVLNHVMHHIPCVLMFVFVFKVYMKVAYTALVWSARLFYLQASAIFLYPYSQSSLVIAKM